MELRLELKKKYFFGILTGLLIVIGLLAVNAYGTFNPEIFGHTSSEIDFNLGIEVPADSRFVNSSVTARELCLENGECFDSFENLFNDLELDCTYAVRNSYTNPDEIIIMGGDVDAVELIGTPESGNDSAWWGLECINGYQKTTCQLWNVGSGNQRYDNSMNGDGNNCLTDDEEFDVGAVIGIGCCKIGF